MEVVHLNQKQLAARWSISEATLERSRSVGIGPAKSVNGDEPNPQQHAGTGANRQEKAPTDNSWGFSIGGAGGN